MHMHLCRQWNVPLKTLQQRNKKGCTCTAPLWCLYAWTQASPHTHRPGHAHMYMHRQYYVHQHIHIPYPYTSGLSESSTHPLWIPPEPRPLSPPNLNVYNNSLCNEDFDPIHSFTNSFGITVYIRLCWRPHHTLCYSKSLNPV